MSNMWNFPTLEFDWMLVWADQPYKIVVNIKQQYTLSLPIVGSPTVKEKQYISRNFSSFQITFLLPQAGSIHEVMIDV